MSKGKKKSQRNSGGAGPSNITFSGAFVLSTAQKFKIEGEKQIETFRHFLGRAAGFYLASADVPTAERQQIGIRKELEAIATLHRKYRASLDGLSPLARDRLWCELWEEADRLPFDLIGLADLTRPKPFPDEGRYFEDLDAFDKRIQRRIQGLQNVKNPGGQPERTDIHVFAIMARDFWMHELGRNFTFQSVKGTPKSEAFDFCKHVLSELDPKVTQTKLATAIRQAIKSKKTFARVPS